MKTVFRVESVDDRSVRIIVEQPVVSDYNGGFNDYVIDPFTDFETDHVLMTHHEGNWRIQHKRYKGGSVTVKKHELPMRISANDDEISFAFNQ